MVSRMWRGLAPLGLVSWLVLEPCLASQPFLWQAAGPLQTTYQAPYPMGFMAPQPVPQPVQQFSPYLAPQLPQVDASAFMQVQEQDELKDRLAAVQLERDQFAETARLSKDRLLLLHKENVQLAQQVKEHERAHKEQVDEMSTYARGLQEQLGLARGQLVEQAKERQQLEAQLAERQRWERDQSALADSNRQHLAEQARAAEDKLTLTQREHQRLLANLTETLTHLGREREELVERERLRQEAFGQLQKERDRLAERERLHQDELGQLRTEGDRLREREQQNQAQLQLVQEQLAQEENLLQVTRSQEAKDKVTLAQLAEQVTVEKRAHDAAQSEVEQAIKQLNATENQNSFLQMRLSEALDYQRRLNASSAQSSLLQSQYAARYEDTERRLQASQERERDLEATLAEERSDRQRERLASRELQRERDTDKAFLETSSRLLRGGESRLKMAAQELQQAKERTALLEAELASQRNATDKAEAKAAEQAQLLNLRADQNTQLQEKLDVLKASPKRLAMLPWAELLSRCRQDVCFALAHRVACCGGPQDAMVARPASCDLAARVALGEAALPEVCVQGGAVGAG